MTATIVGPGGDVEITNDEGDPITTINVSSLVPAAYDDIQLGYTGADLTSVAFYSVSTLVATLTLTYVGGVLARVQRI